MDEQIRDFDGPVVGLCGGYQLLGERITNGSLEGTGDGDVFDGLGLLPVETRFEEDKRVEPVTQHVEGVGPLAGASGEVSGYEIHMGRTRLVGDAVRPFPDSGAATDRVLGTYLHGLFENPTVREAFVETVREAAGVGPLAEDVGRRAPHDRAADLLREHVAVDDLL